MSRRVVLSQRPGFEYLSGKLSNVGGIAVTTSRLTYEVKSHTRTTLVRPSVMMPEGVGIAVGHPESGVDHASIGIISGRCSSQDEREEGGSSQEGAYPAPPTAHLEKSMNDAVEAGWGGGKREKAKTGSTRAERWSDRPWHQTSGPESQAECHKTTVYQALVRYAKLASCRYPQKSVFRSGRALLSHQ